MKVISAVERTTGRGGQTSLGLFGIPGFDASVQPHSRCPHVSRIKGALTAKVQPVMAPARRPSVEDEPELVHSRWLADLAESYSYPFDVDAAAYARSFAGVGYAEHLMALEG